MRLNLYSQNRHTVVVDGVALAGFAEGDYIQVKKDGNAAQRTQGGDGPAMNISTDQGGQITIGLNPTSPALGFLYEIREQQRVFPRLISIVLITGTEEVIIANGCGFGDLPQFQSGGPTMQPRQFVFECLQIEGDLSETEPIEGGFVV